MRICVLYHSCTYEVTLHMIYGKIFGTKGTSRLEEIPEGYRWGNRFRRLFARPIGENDLNSQKMDHL